MALYKRGGIWWCSFRAKGHATVKESSGTANRAAAHEYHDRRAAELWRIRRLGERPRVSFADAAADWLTGYSRHKKSHEDDKRYLATMLAQKKGEAPLLPAWLDELTTSRMTAIRDHLRSERGLSPATLNKYLSILSRIWHYAHERELVAAVPAIPTFKRRQKGGAKRFTVLTPEQAATFFKELPAHLLPMVRFALSTGLRDSNVRGLLWENVDMTRRLARVWGEDAKGGELIAVPLSDDALAVLQGCQGQHPTHVFTFGKIGKHGRSSGAGRSPARRTTLASGRHASAPVCPGCAGTTCGTRGRRGTRRPGPLRSFFKPSAGGKMRAWCARIRTWLRWTCWITPMRSGFPKCRMWRVQIRPQWPRRTMGNTSKCLM